MDYTRPFTLRAADHEARAVLFIHGFTGSPFELHLLAQHVHKAGAGPHCAAPLLAGHHTTVAALAATRWTDWLATAEEALHTLWTDVRKSTGARPRLAVIGLSMGGLLALELGRRYPAAADGDGVDAGRPAISTLGVLASPIFLPPRQTRAIRRLAATSLLRRLAVPKLFGADLRERNRPQPPLRPRAMPIAALDSLLDLMQEVRGHLGEIAQPTLLAHGMKDHTAPYASMAAIASGLGTPLESLRCLALPRSYHLIPLDVEREILFEEVTAHLDRYLLAPPSETR
jgi:carboxylesterase